MTALSLDVNLKDIWKFLGPRLVYFVNIFTCQMLLINYYWFCHPKSLMLELRGSVEADCVNCYCWYHNQRQELQYFQENL